MKRWFRIAARHDVVTRGAKVGFVVGTVLVAINQGDAIVAGNWSAVMGLKILMTYCVPYCVSTYASVSAILALETTGAS